MASDQSNDFNKRLNQWVASQGFWFQMRYSSAGSKSMVAFHLLRLAARALIFLVVVLIGLSVYLVRLSGTPGFHKKLRESIAASLGASEVEMGNFRRVQGQLLMARLAGQGGNETFFSTFEARNIRCQMGLFNGLIGDWTPGVLMINQLDIELNAGADDEKAAGLIANSLFRDFGTLKLDSLDVREATLRWGYSERTRGKVAGSHMKIQRVADGWRIHLAGGTISQSWWRRLEIVELVAMCTRDGVVFEKAEFRNGAGKVTMDGLKVLAGQRPEVKGSIKVSKIALENIVPPAARDFIDGTVSGVFRVFGSTNSSEGIGFEGKFVLDGENVIKLRERLYLLRALTDFDVFNNYRSVAFNEGSIKIKTQGGIMDVSEVDMRAGDLMTLTGQMRVRPPTPEETSASMKRTRTGDASPTTSPSKGEMAASRSPEDEADLTLRRAARAARKDKGKAAAGPKTEEGSSLFERIDQGLETNLLAEQASERESRRLIYEGRFQVTLLPDTFENVQALREMLPVDPQTGRIPLDVPIKGDIYSLTFDQAEDLYLRGQRYKQ